MEKLDPFRHVRLGDQAIKKLIAEYDFETVLDVGCGEGFHSLAFVESGKTVTGIAFSKEPWFLADKDNFTYVNGDYNRTKFAEKFDLVWASHVLEHQPNVGNFIKRLFNDCKDGGIVAITVPPLKHNIVGGHLVFWNPGLLLYNIVFAGFDCREAAIKQYGYNISLIVRKKKIAKMPKLCWDNGDIEKLLPYMPAGLTAPSFEGNFTELQWNSPKA